MHILKDISGQTFNCWTVLKNLPSRRIGKAFHSQWLCRCICGVEKAVSGGNLRGSRSKSCGCQNRSTFSTTKICPGCKIQKLHDAFYRTASARLSVYCIHCTSDRSSETYKRFRPIRRAAVIRHSRALRKSILENYGGACACCGESREIFIALDHINGGGTKEAERMGSGGVYRKVRDAGFPKDKYQLLCHNCNWAKHHTNGNCPHKQPSWMPPTFGGFSCVGG